MPGDLRGLECMLFALQPTGAWYYRMRGQPDSPLNEVSVDGRLRANDSEAIRDAALAGLGIALLPTWLIGPDVRAGNLVTVLPDWEWLLAPGPERAIWAIYPPKKVVAPKVSSFVAFMVDRFGKIPYWEEE